VGASTSVTVDLSSAASNLFVGDYSASICFSNVTTSIGHIRHFILETSDSLDIQPAGIAINGPAGGLFDKASQVFTLSNSSASSLSWSVANTSVWYNLSPSSGILDAYGTTNVTAVTMPAANNLAGGTDTTSIVFQNLNLSSSQLGTVTLLPSQSFLVNGGFETGDFTDWTLMGDTTIGNVIYNAVVNQYTLGGVDCVHSGLYGAALGESGYLAYLSQSLTTQPRQTYLISFWLQNLTNDINQEFLLNWNATSGGTTNLIDMVNPGAFVWTNLTFLVSALDTNSTLQIGARNDNDVFGLDDVSVTPVPIPTILSLSSNNNVFSFKWNALPTVQYQVEYTTDLANGPWVVDGTLNATNYLLSWSINLGTNSARFYRIQQLP
jgi:hypothetical protein